MVGSICCHCNAFVVNVAPIQEMESDQWDRQIAVNLSSVFHAMRACLPLLRSSRGSVVLTSSVHAVRGVRRPPRLRRDQGRVAVAWSGSSPWSYGPDIRVNAVLPGPILTAAWDRVGEQDRARSVAADGAQAVRPS